MRKENNYDEQEVTLQSDYAFANGSNSESAFGYLKALPRNTDRPALDSYKRGKDSQIIDHLVAQDFTDNFRTASNAFYIPVSWTMTKVALVNLLGITSYEGYDEVNGVRFYAGINSDNQLTLIAVSTMAGSGCNDDLTVDDEYPYYDFADPCPVNCSNTGNLKTSSAASLRVTGSL